MVLKQIKRLDKKIERLEHKKEKLIEKSEKIYCRNCNKLYPSSKCKSWLEFSDGGFLEDIVYKCPKGHEWGEK